MSGSRIDLADRFTRQGSARPDSDWDFLAFGSEESFRCLERNVALHWPHTDCLVVTNGEDFRTAWGEKNKTGSLSEWEWKQISETEAQYTETKWVENEEQARVVSKRRRAVRV